MALLKRTVKPTVMKTKTTKVHQVDGITYKSAAMVAFHNELKVDPLIKSFSLPSAKEEAKTNTGRYHAKKCTLNGYTFDSMSESRFYIKLLHEKAEGKITDFIMQEEFMLQEQFRNPFTNKVVKPIKYIADFVIEYPGEKLIIVDVKGKETAEFKLKMKLFLFKYPELEFRRYKWDQKNAMWLCLDKPPVSKPKKARKKKTTKKVA